MPQISIETNRSLLTDERDNRGRSQELLIRAIVTAPDQVQSTARRLPLHLAIVIDRSGSMSGRKLSDASTAAQRMIQRLDDEDRCVVVTFDTTVSVLADGAPLSAARRAMLSHALTLVQAGSSTNLAGGWDEGVRQLLPFHTPNECVSRVVILTDGAANVGLTDTDALAAQARIYAERGVSTSTYGLGNDYNETTLTAMSQAGLGNHHFVAQSSEIDAFFSDELRELFAVALTNTVLTAQIPAGYTCELIGGGPHRVAQQQVSIDIGELVALEKRGIFFRLTPLSLTPHGQHALTLTMTGTDTVKQERQATATTRWVLTTAQQAATAQIHTDIEEEAGLIDLARVRAEANRLNQEGRYHEARAYIVEQQTRSEVFSKIRLYQEAAEIFAQPTTSEFRKSEASSANMRRRFSSKDLYVLNRRLLQLIETGAPAHEIDAVRLEITRLERYFGGN